MWLIEYTCKKQKQNFYNFCFYIPIYHRILFIIHLFITLILPRSTYGNGMVLHFYQQQESSTTKTVHKVINKGLKTYV